MYTFAHKKKKEQHRDAFIHTRVFIFGHKVFKREANILSALMSLAQADFFRVFVSSTSVGKVEEYMGQGKGKAVVNTICFYVHNLRGGLPYHFLFSG